MKLKIRIGEMAIVMGCLTSSIASASPASYAFDWANHCRFIGKNGTNVFGYPWAESIPSRNFNLGHNCNFVRVSLQTVTGGNTGWRSGWWSNGTVHVDGAKQFSGVNFSQHMACVDSAMTECFYSNPLG